MQVNKMGGQALDEKASSPPILCLILVVLRIVIIGIWLWFEISIGIAVLWGPSVFANVEASHHSIPHLEQGIGCDEGKEESQQRTFRHELQ